LGVGGGGDGGGWHPREARTSTHETGQAVAAFFKLARRTKRSAFVNTVVAPRVSNIHIDPS
jgi:hypothetical protein